MKETEKTRTTARVLNALRRQSAAAVQAEGARIGFINCPECGAALLLDDRDGMNVVITHALWHGNLADGG